MTTIACSKSSKYVVVGCDKQNTLMGGPTAFKFKGMTKKIFHPCGNQKIIIGCAGRAMGASLFKNAPKLMKMFSDLANKVYELNDQGKNLEEIGEYASNEIQHGIMVEYKKFISKNPELQEKAKMPMHLEEDEEGGGQIIVKEEIFSSINIICIIGVYIITMNANFDVAIYDENCMALGSGTEVAMGAMYALAKNSKLSPEQIVEAAIDTASRFDPYTGNEIYILKTEKMK